MGSKETQLFDSIQFADSPTPTNTTTYKEVQVEVKPHVCTWYALEVAGIGE